MRFSLWGKEIQVADWREEEHSRIEDGKFTDKGGDKKSSVEKIKGFFERRKTLAKSEKKEYNNNGKERNGTEGYVLNDPESIEVAEHIERGNLYDLETLYNLPVFKRIEEKISEYDSKYGKTSKITDAERIKNRDKWIEDFLNGANGAETMPPNGAPLKRESKATIVVGLPAAGKSTTIANPLSEEQGAFILDSDEMKKLIPEYKETNGGAANAVHDESKDLMRRALKEFTEGSRKGTNLVIPIIGDKIKSINGNYIHALHNAGYDVEIAYKYADTKTSANRVVARAIKTGRFIPREVVKRYNDNAIRNAYEEILGTDYNGKKVKRSKYSEL